MSDPGGPPRRAIAGAYTVSAVLVAATVALVATLPTGSFPRFDAPIWIVLPIGLGYFLAERYSFDVDFRRETLSFAMSEVPTVFALAFLGPLPALAARLTGGLSAVLARGRPPGFKFSFNAALFTAETALAFAIVGRLAGAQPEVGAFLIAAIVATTITTIAGVVAVCVVISLFEGDLLGQLRAAATSTALTAVTASLVAGIAVAPALIGLAYAPLPMLPLATVWFVLRRHGTLAQQHRDLQDLHHFTRAIDQSLDLDVIGDRAVAEVERLVSAGRVTLRLSPSGGSTETFGSVETFVWSVGVPIGQSETDVVPPPDRLPLDSIDVGEGFAVPVVDRGDRLGTLLVAAPTPRQGSFDAESVERARDLVDQLAGILRNGLLHAAVERVAHEDPLTGEANRASFEQHLADAFERSDGGVAAVLVLDLNQFKEVNDTLGHQVGDQVLIEFARRLTALLEPDDLLARLGGDEFAVFVRRADKDDVRAFTERVLATSYTPLSLDACEAVVTASIGVAFVDDHDTDVTMVLRRADIAMYTAKNQRSGSEVYREEIDRRTPARLSLLGDLRSAIEHRELDVHFQPKVDLRRDAVIGAEALVRWCHPDRGWIPPDDFIGVAEQSGLIRLVTDTVLDLSIAQAAKWRRRGYDFDVAVNLSTLDLHGDDLVERIGGLLDRHGVDAHNVILEITESALMVDTSRTMATIGGLDELGVRLSLDDFGTGYSSLSYVRRLPVSELKIDRSFVSDLLLNDSDDVIVRSTIDLGHNLGLRVVAEGIENSQVFEHLERLGCDVGQGFGIARPLAADTFDRWLETTTHAVRRVRPLGLVADAAG